MTVLSLCSRALLAAFLFVSFLDYAYATDLMDAYKMAERSDPQYRQAAANKRAVMLTKPEAVAQYLPNLNGTAGVTYNFQDITGGNFGAGVYGYESHEFGISMRQPLFHWDRYLQIRQADSSIKQADAQLTLARQQLMVRVAQAYFNVLAAQDSLEFARAEKRALKRQLDQTKQRFQVGLTAITDVQEARAGFDRATAQEIAAKNEIDNTQEALRAITGQYTENLAGLSDKMPLVKPSPADIDAWTNMSLHQNLAVIAAQDAVDVSRQQVKVQHAGHYPTLDLVGQYGFNTTGGRFGNSVNRDGSVSVQLNIPIYQGGYVSFKTREAQQRQQEQMERLVQARRDAHRQTRQSYLGVISGISQIKALKQAVVSSETALESTQAGYEVGTRTAVDVVTAEQATFQAKRNYARARYNYLIDTLQLKLASGALSTDDLSQINMWLK